MQTWYQVTENKSSKRTLAGVEWRTNKGPFQVERTWSIFWYFWGIKKKIYLAQKWRVMYKRMDSSARSRKWVKMFWLKLNSISITEVLMTFIQAQQELLELFLYFYSFFPRARWAVLLTALISFGKYNWQLNVLHLTSAFNVAEGMDSFLDSRESTFLFFCPGYNLPRFFEVTYKTETNVTEVSCHYHYKLRWFLFLL